MGFPMAGHLAAKGHAVTVWNRSPQKAAAWVASHGGPPCPATPREAAEGGRVRDGLRRQR
jgi:3-hydroxyisobutyrate dehydrogenase